jgi:hypothetical protein
MASSFLNLISQAYTWGQAVGIAFVAAGLAILLIQFVYNRSS